MLEQQVQGIRALQGEVPECQEHPLGHPRDLLPRQAQCPLDQSIPDVATMIAIREWESPTRSTMERIEEEEEEAITTVKSQQAGIEVEVLTGDDHRGPEMCLLTGTETMIETEEGETEVITREGLLCESSETEQRRVTDVVKAHQKMSRQTGDPAGDQMRGNRLVSIVEGRKGGGATVLSEKTSGRGNPSIRLLVVVVALLLASKISSSHRDDLLLAVRGDGEEQTPTVDQRRKRSANTVAVRQGRIDERAETATTASQRRVVREEHQRRMLRQCVHRRLARGGDCYVGSYSSTRFLPSRSVLSLLV